MITKVYKCLAVFLTALFLFGVCIPAALALDPQPEPPGEIKIMIDNRWLISEIAPIIESGRTLVPLRATFEALGAQVVWNPTDKSITATRNDLIIQLKIASKLASKNGTPVAIEVEPRVLNGRTLVPLRFVSEALGSEVKWDGTKRIVSIIASASSSTGEQPEDGNQPTNPVILPFKPIQDIHIIDIPSIDKLSPAVRLSNNKIYPLMPSGPEVTIPKLHFQAPYAIPASVRDKLKLIPPAATVDLRQWQTSIKDQAGRNTCVTHAVVAAMEAAYKRLDPAKYANIDLSEQYGHFLQKLVFLDDSAPKAADLRENHLGRWGFGGTLYSMALFARPYCVPEETLLPYIEGGSYENTNEERDNPRINPADLNLKQKTIDDVNLSETDFPRAALDGSVYGISSYAVVPWDKLKDVDYYRAVMASGYEIAFSAKILTPDPSPDNGIWDVGTNHVGNHAMLMVGYDDTRKVFIVKNSWAYDNALENGFTLMSYDWVKQGQVYEAGYITGVLSPQTNNRPEQKFLGRWKMDHDGWKGTLDINRIPDFFQNDWPRDAAFGTKDLRIGTYFHQDGSVHRVNGMINGNRIEFYIDFDNPNMKYDELRGKRFIGYLFGWQSDLIAGSMASDNQPYGFYATKSTALSSQAASTGDINESDYTGVWAMNHDGWKGTLTISGVNSKTHEIKASYKSEAGKAQPVTGFITEGRKLSMDISFDGASPQPFSGMIFSWEKGVMSGSTNWNGQQYGWVATRTGPAPLTIIPGLRLEDRPILRLK